MTYYVWVFLKGIAMGAADVVPGVSGGTIAFITGIYDTLIESIRSIRPNLWSFFRKNGLKKTLNHINFKFLLVLFAGIFTSIISLAKLISYLLEEKPIETWSFFFGLILISIFHVAKAIEVKNMKVFISFILGAIFAFLIVNIAPIEMKPTYINVLLSGSIAICAMILPGISGSFILLLLGMYQPILSAVKSGNIPLLSCFLLGAVLGLLSFSHLLSYLLKHFKSLTLSFLTGLMAGTLPKIWPWKETVFDSLNQIETVNNILPSRYEAIYQTSSQLGFAILYMLLAFILVFALEMMTKDKKTD